MSILFDSGSELLADMIRATATRHRVLAANLANIETPGYQAQEVTFSEALAQAQGGGTAGSGSSSGVAATVGPDPEATPRRDGNSVDLDRQMVKLAQNTTWHNALVQLLAGNISTVKMAMRDRI